MNSITIFPYDAEYKGSLFNPKAEILYPHSDGIIFPSDSDYKGSLFSPKVEILNPHSDRIIFPSDISFNLTKFSFDTASSIFEKVINFNTGVLLRIENINNSIAHVYFLDSLKRNILIPEKFVIIDNSNNIEVKKTNESFYLCWSDNYTFFYNDVQLLKLNTSHIWNIS